MALLWNEKYRLGETTIDAEHHEWFRLANDFLAAPDRESRIESGEAFSLYTGQHFKTEETLMQEIQYPFISAHVGEHERLFSTLNKIFDINVDEILSSSELDEFVAYTLTKHITTFDSPLSLYIKRHVTDQVT
jgi:hemerythrin-like metal-binding protein